MKQVRFVVLAVIAMVFGVVSMASAQVTSSNDGYNEATIQLENNGWSVEMIEFTVPTRVLTHPEGYFRPDATIEVRVPITNTSKRRIECSAQPSVLDAVAKGVASVQQANNIAVHSGATGNMVYYIQFKPENEWRDGNGSGHYERYFVINFNIRCVGDLPNISPQSF